MPTPTYDSIIDFDKLSKYDDKMKFFVVEQHESTDGVIDGTPLLITANANGFVDGTDGYIRMTIEDSSNTYLVPIPLPTRKYVSGVGNTKDTLIIDGAGNVKWHLVTKKESDQIIPYGDVIEDMGYIELPDDLESNKTISIPSLTNLKVSYVTNNPIITLIRQWYQRSYRTGLFNLIPPSQ